jgi:hypothetical protein
MNENELYSVLGKLSPNQKQMDKIYETALAKYKKKVKQAYSSVKKIIAAAVFLFTVGIIPAFIYLSKIEILPDGALCLSLKKPQTGIPIIDFFAANWGLIYLVIYVILVAIIFVFAVRYARIISSSCQTKSPIKPFRE